MKKLKCSEALGRHAILKRITGLTTVKFKSRPSRFGVDKEAYVRKDQNVDGEFLEDFNSNVLPGAITGLAPFWNDFSDSFWLEDRWILDELVEAIKLRFPDDYPDRARQIIKPEDVDPYNFYDPFFQHEQLQSKRMFGGKYTFELQKDPIDILLYYCYKNDPRVLIRDGKEISKYVVGRAEYELIIPSETVSKSKGTLKKEVDALTNLGAMSFDKQKYIARIMKLRLESYDNPNPDDLYLSVGEIAKNTTKSSKWGGMTGQEKFLQLSSMPNEDLILLVDIERGKDSRIITVERDKYLLNSEVIEGVKDENDLFKFFKNGNNSSKYKDLLFLIGEKEKQIA